MRLNPSPGYIICKPHKIEKKVGAFEVPSGDDDPEKAPEFGEVLAIGDVITKMPYDVKHVPKVGDKIAYKKYNYFTLTIGVKQYVAVHFENVLFTIEEDE